MLNIILSINEDVGDTLSHIVIPVSIVTATVYSEGWGYVAFSSPRTPYAIFIPKLISLKINQSQQRV